MGTTLSRRSVIGGVVVAIALLASRTAEAEFYCNTTGSGQRWGSCL